MLQRYTDLNNVSSTVSISYNKKSVNYSYASFAKETYLKQLKTKIHFIITKNKYFLRVFVW